MYRTARRIVALCAAGAAAVGCGSSSSPVTPVQGSGSVADHLAAASYEGIPATAIDSARSSLRVLYGHTSHGSQLLTGMQMLGGAGGLSITELSADLGTGGDLTWASTTRARLGSSGNGFNVVVWSWCGGVSGNSTAGIDAYLQAMEQLEHDYPTVTFVYMTGHTDGSGATGSLRTNNARIRQYCVDHGKWLFDFEAIESYDPAGNDYPDTDDSCPWCSAWCSTHSCPACGSCAHSHCFNCYLKGKAFWWLLARMAGWSA